MIGIYAFGSIIEENDVPSWSPDNEESRTEIEDALTWAGVGYQHVHRANDTHGDEIKPGQHMSKLGRALFVAGAPVGEKTAATMQGLPDWVDDAALELRVELATLFVRGRGVEHEDKATRTIQTDRHRRYFEDVAALIEDTTGKSATASDHSLTVSADAVRDLGLADDYERP